MTRIKINMPRTKAKASDPDRVLRSTRNAAIEKPSIPATSAKPRTRTTRFRGGYREDNAQSQSTAVRRPKRILPSYLQRSQAEVTSDPNRHVQLLALPQEILQEVVSHLSPALSVCLTLTCKFALQILGTSFWTDQSLRKRIYWGSNMGIYDRSTLLELLFRDIGGHVMIHCERCSVIHGPLRKPSEHKETKFTKYCWGQDAVIDYYPKSELGGYSLVFEHIKHVLESTSPDFSSPIEYLSGSFLIPNPHSRYTLSTCGRRIGGNLVIQHNYVFRPSSPNDLLNASQILGIPLRICPHQSTHTIIPPVGRHNKYQTPNGPLFTHSIVCAFPAAQRKSVPSRKVFRKTTPLEEQMLASIDAGEKTSLRCRFCPTKWAVEYSARSASGNLGRGELEITVWHCFYKELYMAAKVWAWFVRREGQLLGKSKMNTEFWSQARSITDFRIE